MSNSSPFLQELTANMTKNGANEEEVNIVVNDLEADLKLQKDVCNDTEGYIWNSETNTCEKKMVELVVEGSGGVPESPDPLSIDSFLDLPIDDYDVPVISFEDFSIYKRNNKGEDVETQVSDLINNSGLNVTATPSGLGRDEVEVVLANGVKINIPL